MRCTRSGGTREPRQPDHAHSEHANSCGLSGIQHPPTAYFEKSKSALGIPQMIFRKLPVVPQEGQGAVFIDIFLESFIWLNLYKGTDTPTLKSLPNQDPYLATYIRNDINIGSSP